MGCDDLIVNNMSSKQFERTRYFSRQLITADDLTQDQDYYREKRRMHNRLLHGWGIVCGLEVKTNTAPSLIITICPGYALSPQGDEIYVPTEVQFDLSQCIKGQDSPCHSPCAPVVPYAVDPHIAIKYAQCMSHPVRVPPLGCGCDDTACEYSRTRDSYELTCLPTLPTRDTGHCTECPTNPWVVLARVGIDTGGVPQIDTSGNSGRSIFLRSAVNE